MNQPTILISGVFAKCVIKMDVTVACDEKFMRCVSSYMEEM